MKEALGDEAPRDWKGRDIFLSDARVGKAEGYAGALGANSVERLAKGLTSSAHPYVCIYG